MGSEALLNPLSIGFKFLYPLGSLGCGHVIAIIVGYRLPGCKVDKHAIHRKVQRACLIGDKFAIGLKSPFPQEGFILDAPHYFSIPGNH